MSALILHIFIALTISALPSTYVVSHRRVTREKLKQMLAFGYCRYIEGVNLDTHKQPFDVSASFRTDNGELLI